MACACEFPVFRVKSTLDTKEEDNFCFCLSRNRNLLTGHESTFKVWSSINIAKYEWTLLHEVRVPEKGDVLCISQFPDSDEKYAVSFNNCVAVYSFVSEIALIQPLHIFRFNDDEINQLDINAKSSFICSSDDSGDIKVIDVQNVCLYKSLTRQHRNICSAVKFNPRKPWEIFSGGLDCQLIRWDFNRGRPLFVVDLQTAHRDVGMKDDEEQTVENYMVNPPMAHSIDILRSIHSVVCGLGNGYVSVYSALSSKKLELVCSAPMHSACVAFICCVEIPGMEPKLTKRFIISGGNDGKICVSRLKYEENTTQARLKKQHRRLQQGCGELELTVTIQHRSKVNWMAVHSNNTSSSIEATETNTSLSTLMIFVADQTSVITVYECSV